MTSESVLHAPFSPGLQSKTQAEDISKGMPHHQQQPRQQVVVHNTNFKPTSAPCIGPEPKFQGIDVTLLQSQFSDAFLLKSQGRPENYKQIVRQLSANSNTAFIGACLVALSRCASEIPANSNELLSLILKFDWSSDEATAVAYRNFLLNLVTAKSIYLESVLEMLVLNLFPKSSIMMRYDAVQGRQMSDRIYAHVHETFSCIVKILPASKTSIMHLLQKNFPHKSRDLECQRDYTKNLLRIASYIPLLRDSILSLLIENMVLLDVEIKLEELEEEDKEELDLQFEFSLDGEPAPHSVVKSQPPQEQQKHPIVLLAEKLDVMMDVVYEYLFTFSDKPSGERDSMFKLLLDVFNRSVLNTFKSKYIQFLLFFFCSLDPSYTQLFVMNLLERLFNHTNHAVVRQSCAAYVGSFIARASYIPQDLINFVFEKLMEWTLGYVEMFDSSVTFPDAELHCVFYSVCQTLFYIFCFKHKEILKRGTESDVVGQLNHIVCSKLNPFKIILQSIVHEFCIIAGNYHLFDCRHVVQQNRFLILPTKSSFGGSNHLEMFFPFDPYLLHDSVRWVSGLYEAWRPVDASTQEEATGIPVSVPRDGRFDEAGRAASYSSEMNNDDYNSDSEDDSDRELDSSSEDEDSITRMTPDPALEFLDRFSPMKVGSFHKPKAKTL